MGANKSARQYRGQPISTVQRLVLNEYMAWYDSGRQDGVLNLIGPAGIGKTECIYQLAEVLKKKKQIKNAAVYELYLGALMDPESAAGCPVPVDGKIGSDDCKVLKVAWREELVDAVNKGKGGILFVDEVGREADQMRPLMLKLLHEKKLGGLDVSNMFLLVAGNPADEEHNVTAIQEDAALSSRLVDIPVKADVREMQKYFNKFTPSHKEVANFVLDNPNYLFGRDTDGDQSSKYHCPRAWFNAAWKLHIHGGGTDKTPGNIKEPAVATVLTGLIGPQAYSFIKQFMATDKPLTVQQVLKGKFRTPVRSVAPSTQESIKAYLNEYELTDPEADNLVKFLDEMPADRARAVMREASQGKILPKNNRKLVARDVFKKFVRRMSGIKKASSDDDDE